MRLLILVKISRCRNSLPIYQWTKKLLRIEIPTPITAWTMLIWMWHFNAKIRVIKNKTHFLGTVKKIILKKALTILRSPNLLIKSCGILKMIFFWKTQMPLFKINQLTQLICNNLFIMQHRIRAAYYPKRIMSKNWRICNSWPRYSKANWLKKWERKPKEKLIKLTALSNKLNFLRELTQLREPTQSTSCTSRSDPSLITKFENLPDSKKMSF